MSRIRKSILATALILGLLAGAGSLAAQALGRVRVKVYTPEGNPAPGVEIVVTSDEITTFEKKLKTNKKGQATLSVVHATSLYNLHVEHEGYPPQDVGVRPQQRSTITQDIYLGEGGGPGGRHRRGAQGTADHHSLQDRAVAGTARAASPMPTFRPTETVFNEGVAASDRGDQETAKAKFRQAVGMDPAFARGHLALATLHFELGDHEAALAAADQTVALEPGNVRAHRIRYGVLTELGRTDEASQEAMVLGRLDNSAGSVAIVFNEGVAAGRRGDGETAETIFLRALEMDATLTTAMSALAIVYLQEAKYPEAAEMAERYLALKPDDVKVLRMRWDAYRAAGDTENEKTAFDALVAVDPDWVLAGELFNEGAELFTSNELAQAQSNFEKVLEIDPKHARAHFQLALCLTGSDPAKAKELLERFLELAPDDPEAPSAQEMLKYIH